MAKYTAGNKKEIPDNTPVELPIGYRHPETLQQMITRMVRTASAVADREGAESFEESDDFDINDDSDLHSPYQLSEMQEEYVQPTPPKSIQKRTAPAQRNGQQSDDREGEDHQDAQKEENVAAKTLLPPKATKTKETRDVRSRQVASNRTEEQ